jgi:Cu+-exporting ATPase
MSIHLCPRVEAGSGGLDMTTAQPNQMNHDVICHMDVSIDQAAGRSDFDGRTYYFCATSCKEQFDQNPEAALKVEDAYDHSVKPAATMGSAIE